MRAWMEEQDKLMVSGFLVTELFCESGGSSPWNGYSRLSYFISLKVESSSVEQV
nr:hypothetical protein Q903MT_gene4885 [Picea sitchensis]